MHTMHLLPGVAIQPNLELKTRPKPVLGSLPLAFALPERAHRVERHALPANKRLCKNPFQKNAPAYFGAEPRGEDNVFKIDILSLCHNFFYGSQQIRAVVS